MKPKEAIEMMEDNIAGMVEDNWDVDNIEAAELALAALRGKLDRDVKAIDELERIRIVSCPKGLLVGAMTLHCQLDRDTHHVCQHWTGEVLISWHTPK